MLVCNGDMNIEMINKTFVKEANAARSHGLWTRTMKNFVDVGAHYGGYTYEAARLGVEKIYSFEASYTNFHLAQQLLNGHNINNYRIFNLAVSDKSGDIAKLRKITNSGDFQKAESGQYSIIDYKDYQSSSLSSEEYECCMTISLEDIFRVCRLDQIDAMKIDIEGSEYNFLINKDLSRIKTMYIEFHCGPKKNKELCEYLCTYFDIVNAYTSRNNTLHISTEDRLVQIGDIDFDKEIHYMSLANKTNEPYLRAPGSIL